MTFNKNLFLENMSTLGIEIADDKIDLLDKFAERLIETNKVMNLTAILDEDGIAVKHFADSLSILKINIKENAKVMDLGCGAGFPGIPLLIARNDIDLTFVDSTAKKLGFVKDTVGALNLNAEVVHSRAEELGHNPEYREKYDLVVSRAVAALNVLCEYCLPFVKVGGKFAAMKGSLADEEIKQAGNALRILGGKITEKIDFELTDGKRSIIVIEKIAETNAKYPRPSAQIAKKKL